MTAFIDMIALTAIPLALISMMITTKDDFSVTAYSTTICKSVDLITVLRQSNWRIPN